MTLLADIAGAFRSVVCQVLTLALSPLRVAPLIASLVLVGPPVLAFGSGAGSSGFIAHGAGPGRFAISEGGSPAVIFVSEREPSGVRRVAGHLADDIARVTGVAPRVIVGEASDLAPAMTNEPLRVIVVGVLGTGGHVDDLAEAGLFEPGDLEGAWEAHAIERVESPWFGVSDVLVIGGGDKRGAIYGMYAVSRAIGVSPWHWWADVPVEHADDLWVEPGRHSEGEPAVKYRGIFLNDEAPALSGWAHEKFGGVNADFYERVYQLILRLRGNYLWPAMWGRSLWDDDPRSAPLADEYGVVLGTSHHEPLGRAHVEWSRYGEGPWDYSKNDETLRAFWREGVERSAGQEKLVTIGMRGDGDEAMSEEADIALLERIVADQREIIADVTGRPAPETPQVWALYKEVQEYYDRGMRVPDDVTLLLCDDNWGNIRRLPPADADERAGGHGVYYHFDYVGGPRNYKWLNVTQVSRVWEQMRLAYSHGVDRLWVVNVGDLKPMELPISFFLDLAWAPESIGASDLEAWMRDWAAGQFPGEFADEIADLLTGYTNLNSRRNPEMIGPETYSLSAYREWERVVGAWASLVARTEAVARALPDKYADAYWQLVRYPVLACANLNELYYTVALNRWHAEQGRAGTNRLAARARELFARDAELARVYNEDVADGKWRHMMDQTNIGYTYWQQPDADAMPEVREIGVPGDAALGVSVEGDERAWPGAGGEAELPLLARGGAGDPVYGETFFEIFNRGRAPLAVSVEADAAWVIVEPVGGGVRTGGADPVQTDRRYRVAIDWDRAPVGEISAAVRVRHMRENDAEESVVVRVRAHNAVPYPADFAGFIETRGVVSMPASGAHEASSVGGVSWSVIPDLGRTGDAVGAFPRTGGAFKAGEGPCLEYRVWLDEPGEVTVHAFVSPTLDYLDEGLRYAVSFDDVEPVVVDLLPDDSTQAWEKMVGDRVNRKSSTHAIGRAGAHTLKFWLIDPGVVLQRLVIDAGGLAPSYLGPPETPRLGGTPGVALGAFGRGRDGGGAGETARFEFFEYSGNDRVYEGIEVGEDQYLNPIIAGYAPDPSITRAGDRFYMVHSSFCHFPGIPVWESADLVDWTLIGHVIDRPGMLDFEGLGLSRGVFAPAIEHHEGMFYVLNTCVDCGGNYVCTATDPAGPWSDPVWLPDVGGIDPSLFFDDDGKAYIINNDGPIGEPEYDGHRALWIREFDYENLRTVGEQTMILNGGADFSTKPIWIEGPHIFKNPDEPGDWYYLCAAEGGTSTWHSQVVLRAKDVRGPWEAFGGNPILTQRHLDPGRPDPITSAGHADLVSFENAEGKTEWWATFLAVRPYEGNHYNTGRETFLMPVEWREGWPLITEGDELVPYVADRPRLRSDESGRAHNPIPTSGNYTIRDEFEGDGLAKHWRFVRVPERAWWEVSGGSLRLEARAESIGARSQPSFVGTPLRHQRFAAETALRFEPAREGDRAGLALMQSDEHYLFFGVASEDGRAVLRLDRRAGADDPAEGVPIASRRVRVPGGSAVHLRVAGDVAEYRFEYAVGTPGRGASAWTTLAEGVDGRVLSTQSAGGFVGALIGPYAQRGE